MFFCLGCLVSYHVYSKNQSSYNIEQLALEKEEKTEYNTPEIIIPPEDVPEIKKVEVEHDLTNEEITNIIHIINARNAWIGENSDIIIPNRSIENIDDFYINNTLAYRNFYYAGENEEDGAVYSLVYDENNKLIMAEIAHYRSWLYNMYFYNDKLLHVNMEMGPLSIEEPTEYIDFQHAEAIIFENPLYAFVLDDLALCLEYAYKGGEIEKMVQTIDERVKWVNTNRFISDYFTPDYDKEDGVTYLLWEDRLVYSGFSFNDDIEGLVPIELCYDENEKLIYAKVIRDNNVYNLYFDNNELLYIKMLYGPFSNGAPYGNINIERVKEIIEEYPVFDYVLDDIKVCFGYAYKWEEREGND